MWVHTAHHAHKPCQSFCFRFLFADLSSAFSTISPMRLIGTLWVWGPDWILDLDPRQFELAVTPPALWCWTSEPPRAVCSALICSCCTPISAISDSDSELLCNVCWHLHNQPYYTQQWGLISGGNQVLQRWQCAAQHQQNQRAGWWLHKQRKQRHTALSTTVELRWTILCSPDSTSKTRKHRADYAPRGNVRRLNYHVPFLLTLHRNIERILTGSITNWGVHAQLETDRVINSHDFWASWLSVKGLCRA